MNGKRLGRPPGADAEATRNDILDAALRAFAERGFDGASIREITSEVGVGHNLVRHYFGSKEDLWKAAVRRGIGEPAEELAALLDASDVPTPEGLRAALELLMTKLANNPSAIKLFATEALRGGPRFDYIYDEFLAPTERSVGRYAKVRGQRVDPRVLGLFTLSAGISLFTFESIMAKVDVSPPRAGEPLDARAHQLIDLIVAGATGQG